MIDAWSRRMGYRIGEWLADRIVPPFVTWAVQHARINAMLMRWAMKDER